ncbi:hypothetical protein B0T20DRAFT_206055 [Sordaria brevicollis]|uniref:Uncharacterized protein n=1 Tax=Sordaria brevicollis TaxID=83679 RepID=A0AAE0PE68_SORBR|nr:hypothetical protein B0T20DRAFT_206055 [Sordaria brevicollis]
MSVTLPHSILSLTTVGLAIIENRRHVLLLDSNNAVCNIEGDGNGTGTKLHFVPRVTGEDQLLCGQHIYEQTPTTHVAALVKRLGEESVCIAAQSTFELCVHDS